jgi:hypothetical protein
MTRPSDNAEARTRSILASSRLVGVLDHILAAVLAAWRDSFVLGMTRQLIDRAGGGTLPGRLRLSGSVMVVAAATALAMQRLASRPAPLTWIVPALSLFAGACLFAVARAWPERQP